MRKYNLLLLVVLFVIPFVVPVMPEVYEYYEIVEEEESPLLDAYGSVVPDITHKNDIVGNQLLSGLLSPYTTIQSVTCGAYHVANAVSLLQLEKILKRPKFCKSTITIINDILPVKPNLDRSDGGGGGGFRGR